MPAFLLGVTDDMSAIQAEIEGRLATAEPEVEVLLAEVVGGRLVRLFIDHPQGVSLELCERVTKLLPEVRARYALDGHTSFTGELVGATDDAVTVAADTGVVSIAYADIHRSNLVGD